MFLQMSIYLLSRLKYAYFFLYIKNFSVINWSLSDPKRDITNYLNIIPNEKKLHV